MKELVATQLKMEKCTQYLNIKRSYRRFCDSLWDIQYIILLDYRIYRRDYLLLWGRR